MDEVLVSNGKNITLLDIFQQRPGWNFPAGGRAFGQGDPDSGAGRQGEGSLGEIYFYRCQGAKTDGRMNSADGGGDGR